MSIEFIEILDTALEQLRKKDPIPKILERYPNQAEDLVSLLHAAESLHSIQPVEMPSIDAMQSDRNAFLQEITQSESLTVSPGLLTRIKGWSGSLIRWPKINLPYIRKEKWIMSTVLARAVLVIGLLFGATSGVFAMADNSLPNEPMYGAKLAMEQVRLNMASDPAGIATQHMLMAKNRAQEIIRLAQKGTPPDTGTMTRLEYHLNKALQFTAQLGNDGEMLGLLTQTRAMVQEQVQAMNRIQTKGKDSLHEPLQLTLQLLNQFQYRLEAGLQDPQGFRWQYQHGQYGNPDCPSDNCIPAGDEHKYGQSEENPPGQPGGNPDCPSDDCVPAGDEHKYGQSEENPPGQPGGNPDCLSDDCVPVGDENMYGQSEDGAPRGPGGNPDCPNCPCDDCEPAGDQNQYGQNGGDPPGQPGGNPDCPCEDCVPEGDGNQYGPGGGDAPGQPGGNPDCPSGDCTPAGDQNGPKKP